MKKSSQKVESIKFEIDIIDTGLGFSHGMRWGRRRWSGWSAMALVTFGTPSPPGRTSDRRWVGSIGFGSDLKLEISRLWCGRPSLTDIRTICLSICPGRTPATSPNSPWTFALFPSQRKRWLLFRVWLGLLPRYEYM